MDTKTTSRWRRYLFIPGLLATPVLFIAYFLWAPHWAWVFAAWPVAAAISIPLLTDRRNWPDNDRP